MNAYDKKKTQWMGDLYFTAQCAWKKPMQYFVEVTPSVGVLPISAHMLDSLWKMWSCRKWDKWVNISSKEETSYITDYQVAFQMYMVNEYSA